MEEIHNDEENISGLLRYNVKQLTYTKKWLLQKIERYHARIRLFFGSNVTIAIFLGLIYTINDKFDIFHKLVKLFFSQSKEYQYIDVILVFRFFGNYWINNRSSLL